ncbi:MAG: hypothetical protein ABI461_05930 [Polyangiaceae bacterium]
MKSLWLGVFASSVLVSFAACSSSSSTGGGSDSGTAANDSGSSTSGDSGGGSGGVAPLSCEDDSSHNCVHYASIPKGAETTDCPSPAVIVTSCPTTNVVATCAYNSGGTDQLLTWYTGVSANSAALKMTCDSLSGVFTAS